MRKYFSIIFKNIEVNYFSHQNKTGADLLSVPEYPTKKYIEFSISPLENLIF